MTAALLRVAVIGARAWTWLYTLPLADGDRERRRREIHSDLWEFTSDRRGAAPARSAAHVALRCLIGIPDDVLWACERLATRVRPPHLATVLRLAIFAAGTATVALAAGTPPLDPAATLSVTIERAGWMRDASPAPKPRAALAPTIVLRLTNVGARPTPALQVNAVFLRAGEDAQPARGLGTAYAPVVGWRGLEPGTSSRRLLLQGEGLYVLDATSGRRVALPIDRVDPAHVRLFVRHDGGWTLLGDFDIPARPMP